LILGVIEITTVEIKKETYVVCVDIRIKHALADLKELTRWCDDNTTEYDYADPQGDRTTLINAVYLMHDLYSVPTFTDPYLDSALTPVRFTFPDPTDAIHFKLKFM
jgi:hypothetical protein